MFRIIQNAISSVFKQKPAEVSEVNVTVVPTEVVAAEAPTEAPTKEAAAAPTKKKRTYTKKTGPKSAK